MSLPETLSRIEEHYRNYIANNTPTRSEKHELVSYFRHLIGELQERATEQPDKMRYFAVAYEAIKCSRPVHFGTYVLQSKALPDIPELRAAILEQHNAGCKNKGDSIKLQHIPTEITKSDFENQL